MTKASLQLLHEPEQVRVALSPVRQRLLQLLRRPASATELAAELGTSRQRLNYHLRALEAAGLIELVEERRRRGCVERVLGLSANAFLVDPGLMGRSDPGPEEPDPFSSDHLVEVAAGVVGDVARLQSESRQKGMPTFIIETEVSLTGPADVGHFKAALAELVARAVQEFDAPTIGRKYRVVLGGHPAVDVRVEERSGRTVAKHEDQV